MKPCLVDVNVWLALLVRHHVHHELALAWYEGLGERQAGLCRIVQLALVRLLANPTIMGSQPLPAAVAWQTMNELLDDERVEFVPEPPGLDAIFPALLNYPIPTGKLVTDAYLGAFAIAGSRTLVTVDTGFREFRGLNVEWLKPAR